MNLNTLGKVAQIKKIKLKLLKNFSKFLKKRGIDLINDKEIYEVIKEDGALNKFVLEKIGEKEISLAFYGYSNGDSMRNPEITFIVEEQMGFNSEKGILEKKDICLIPTSFQNDWVGAYDEVYWIEAGRIKFKPRGQQELISLAKCIDNDLSIREDKF